MIKVKKDYISFTVKPGLLAELFHVPARQHAAASPSKLSAPSQQQRHSQPHDECLRHSTSDWTKCSLCISAFKTSSISELCTSLTSYTAFVMMRSLSYHNKRLLTYLLTYSRKNSVNNNDRASIKWQLMASHARMFTINTNYQFNILSFAPEIRNSLWIMCSTNVIFNDI